LTGNTDIEDGLARLDKLTQEEARMASAELLKMTHDVDDRVKGVDGKVQDVRSDVQDVRSDVQDVRSDVQDVRSDVHDVDHRVQAIGSNISSRVQAVDDKLDQVNRSLFLQPCSFKPLIPLCR
jgi:methyl-accepting chemotaxis protein